MKLPSWITQYVEFGNCRPLFFLPTERKHDRAGYQAWIMPLAPIVMVLVALRRAALVFCQDVFEVVSMWEEEPAKTFGACRCSIRGYRRVRMLKAWSPLLVLIGFRFERREEVDRIGSTFYVIPPLYGRLHHKVIRFYVPDADVLNWPPKP
jgi:hypothetical protein